MLANLNLINRQILNFGKVLVALSVLTVAPHAARANLGAFDFEPFEFAYPGGLSSPALDGSLLSLEIHEVFGDPHSVYLSLLNLSDLSNSNISPTSPTITGIYFDDNASLLNFGSASIFDQSPSTGFNLGGGAPPNVPGGVSIGFFSDYRVTASPPAPSLGLDPGQFLTLQFGLLGGATAADVFQALANADVSSSLRLALHVQEIGLGVSTAASGSFVTVVPEPGGFLLLAVAGVVLQLRRRRR